MSKKINLTERQLKKAINEISYGTIYNAQSKNEDLFWKIKYSFEDFYNELFEIAGKYIDNPDGRTYTKVLEHDNPYLQEIIKHANIIQSILDKKEKQSDNFNNELGKVDFNSFYNDESVPDDRDLHDFDISYLKNKYPKK